MPFVIQYLIKLSISLSVVWLFYQLVLRRLTFYNWNRWFLLGYSIIAFFIPFINISSTIKETEFESHQIVQLIPIIEQLTGAEKTLKLSQWEWSLILFVAGCIVLFLRFIVQHLSFVRLRNSAKLILDSPVKIYQVDKAIIPFSFGNAIFINQLQHDEDDLTEIIRHEFVHVKQKHSFDMIWAEWLCILNWYNPFAWLIRHAIRQNLEFIADNKLVQNGVDKKQYQYLLLKVIGTSHYSIAANFNFSSLKKRITMMNKMKSAKVHLIKFLFVFPLIGVLMLAFRNQNHDQASKKIVSLQSEMLDTIPTTPKSPKKSALPKNVASIVIIDNHLTVTLKNGSKEEYDLNNPEEKKEFERKYGSIPEPPAPPSPVAPPAAPAPPAPIAPPAPPVEVADPIIPAPPPVKVSDLSIPAAPPAPIVRDLPANVSSIHVINEKVTIQLKDGKIENYNLNIPEEKQRFEKKYGDIIPPSPKPPSAPLKPVVATISKPNIDVKPVVSVNVFNDKVEPVVATIVSAPNITVTPKLSATVTELKPTIHFLSPGESEEPILEITRQTTKERLDKIKKELLSKGYALSITNINYNDGIVQSIEGTISDNNSKSRFVADDFSKIIITKIVYKNGKSGFYIRIMDGSISL